MFFLPSDWHEILDVIVAIVVGDLAVQGLEAMLVRVWRRRKRMSHDPANPPVAADEPLQHWEVWLRVQPEPADIAQPVAKWPSVRYRLNAVGITGAVNEAIHTWTVNHPDRPVLTLLSVKLVEKDLR